MSFKFGTGSSKVIVNPKIVVMGIGGAGCNAVNNMILSGLKGVYFIVANTDAQSLATSLCENRIQLGAALTSGLGAGSAPEIGKKAAEESLHEIEDYIKDANMLFIAAGMGGGTGTGATPVIAKAAKELGILTVAVVTKPFHFEQSKRLLLAEDGITELDRYCDTQIVISNQKLFGIANATTTFVEAFKMADNVLVSGVKCITNLITNPGLVNLDFADVKAVMSSLGRAVMGEGEASGENRAIKAIEAALGNPLVEHSSVEGAKSALINITGGPDMTLLEVSEIMERAMSNLDPNVMLKFGSIIDPEMEGSIRVSLVATGIKDDTESKKNDENKNIPLNGYKKEHIKIEEKHSVKENLIFAREFGERVNPFTGFKKEEVSQKLPDAKNNHISSKLEEEMIFENFEDEEEGDTSNEGGSFFIPKTAARLPKKIQNYEARNTPYSGGNNPTSGGLFSKIFKKG